MSESGVLAFVDGVSSISSHNNVHRIICFKLNAAGQPEKSVELLIPAASLTGFDALQNAAIEAVVRAWHNWRGARAMPSREQLAPRELGPAMRHISLCRVVDDDDYEFRVIGDAHVQAYGTNFDGKRVSDVVAAAPEFGTRLKSCYDFVRRTGSPCAYRGSLGLDIPSARFVWFETCYLPFGDAGVVDHVLNVAAYAPRAGEWS